MPVHCSSGAARSMPRPTAVYNRGMAAPESRRYHRLLHQPLRAWLADRAKAAALGAAIGLAGVEVLYALLRVTPLWWLAAAALAFAFAIALTAVLPVWVLPMFFRLTPLADATLSARLLALADRAGVNAVSVWIADP